MLFTGLEFLQFAVGRYSIMCIEIRKYCIIFSLTITDENYNDKNTSE